jgi:hypothetical protein
MYHTRPPLVAPNDTHQKFTRDPRRGIRSYGKMAIEQIWLSWPIRVLIVTGIHDNPRLFVPSPHLCDTVNDRIVQSEIEGGVHLRDVEPGTVLEVRTQNRAYTIEYQGSGQALISGHPVFCPQPVLVNIHGSTWGGSMLKEKFIGRGMCLEFAPPTNPAITTSVIVEVRETPKAA